VDLHAVTIVSKEHTASISNPEIEAVCSSETLVSTYKSTLRHNADDRDGLRGVHDTKSNSNTLIVI
jgi:hypothetical protein